jgi:hypothetical protein
MMCFCIATVKYTPIRERPNVVKSFVRVSIPLNVIRTCPIEQVEKIVRSALKEALSGITSSK